MFSVCKNLVRLESCHAFTPHTDTESASVHSERPCSTLVLLKDLQSLHFTINGTASKEKGQIPQFCHRFQ